MASSSSNGSSRTFRRTSPAKRQKLRREDHVSVHLLHPFGISGDLGATLADFWAFASKGDKRVAFFTELASTNPMMRGIAIMRTAHILNLAIKELSRDHWKSLLNANIYDALEKDMKAISTWLDVLDVDQGSPTGTASSVAIGLTSTSGVEEAAKQLHAYLANERSPLRVVLSMLSSGGLIYAASMADRCASAAICRTGGDLDEADFITAVRSRVIA